MATVTLRPTGTTADEAAIATAVAAAVDGDILVLKARKQSDEPAGPVTPWHFVDGTSGMGTAIYRTPSGTLDFNDPYPLAIGVDSKQITIKGDVDGSNVPITLLKGVYTGNGDAADLHAYMLKMAQYYVAFDLQYLSGAFFVAGGPKKVRFENLSFKFISHSGIFACCPIEIVNCRWDYCGIGVHYFKDNRYTGQSLIQDCVVSNSDWRPYMACGSDIEIRNCSITGLSSEWTDPAHNVVGTGNLWLPDGFWAYGADTTGWGEALELTQLVEHKNVYMVGCSVDFTGSVFPLDQAICMADNFGFNVSDVENVVVDSCSVTGVEAVNGPVVRGSLFADSCSVVNYTFTDCASTFRAIVLLRGWGYGEEASNCLVANNIYNECKYGPAELFLFANSCQSVKNDYTDSELPTNAVDDFASCIVLLNSSNNTIFETGKFPAGQGGAKFHVSDLDGYNNRIVGTSANKVEKPAGIGSLVKSTMQQDFRTRMTKVAQRSRRGGYEKPVLR